MWPTFFYCLLSGKDVYSLLLEKMTRFKKVKYAYQELSQSENTASPHSQEEEKERAWLIK
jgi:hypothetical protein